MNDLNGLVPNPESFLVPGYSVSQGSTPTDVQNNLSSLHSSYSSLDGGFIWQYEDIVSSSYTVEDYSQAIAQGVA